MANVVMEESSSGSGSNGGRGEGGGGGGGGGGKERKSVFPPAWALLKETEQERH